MNLIHYIKLLLRHKLLLLLVPVSCAATVFFLTRHTQKQYISTTTLYTGVASGYSITSTEDERLDYFAVNNAFDNLLASAKSRETIEQVALKLLADHLALQHADAKILSQAGYDNLRKLAGPGLEGQAKKLKSAELIYNYISSIYSSGVNNPIANILEKPGSYYSIDDLRANLVVTRINTSDILQIVYTCTDPAVCLRTLQLHSLVFTGNYKKLKSDQTFSAVQYFEGQLAIAKAKLQKSEDDLKDFGKQHRLINYYEQTRYIAESKENLDKEIYAQKVIKSGSKDALTLVEKKLHSRNLQVDNSLLLMGLRERLSRANAELEKAKVYGNTNGINQLNANAKALADSLKAVSDQYLNLNYTLETVPRASLIQQWVDNSVTENKAASGIRVLDTQRKNYLDQFDEMAPLGSTLKRLERQIDINEKEFLSILHGLNLARLRQSNLALNSNIVIQDKPFFPLRAQASTRNLLIILSFIAGIAAVVSTVVGRELMDSSIRSPERAKKLIELPVAGVSISNSPVDGKSAYRENLQALLMENLISFILPGVARSVDEKGSAVISLINTKAEVYQSQDIALFDRYLRLMFNNLYWVVPQTHTHALEQLAQHGFVYSYIPSIEQLNYKSVDQFAPGAIPNDAVVIYVSPNLSLHSLPAAIARSADVTLMSFKADDTWQQANKELLQKIIAAAPEAPLYTWLVNVDEANLENTMGEIPKERSWLRRKMKKIIKLNLR